MLDAKHFEHLHQRSLPRVRTPEDRAALVHAAEVVGISNERPEDISEPRLQELLDVIAPLLSAKGFIVRSYGASWLWKLALKHDAAANFLRRAASSRHARTRLIIVQYSGCSRAAGPKEVALVKEVLRAGLQDKSSRVRLFSADRISGYLFLDLLPELERALQIEQHPKARSNMQISRDLLGQGFHVSSTTYSMAEDSVLCYIRLKGASCGVTIPKTLVEEFGLAELVRRARARWCYRKIPGDRFDPLPPGHESTGAWPDSVVNGPHFLKPE